MKEVGEISEIYIYPIKSFPGIKLDHAIITKLGIAHPDNKNIVDRKWMIVDEKGSFKTLRQYPKLALIDLSIEGDYFVFKPRQSKKVPLKVPISPKGLTLKKCRVWNLEIDGYSYGGEVSKWLSDYLEVENMDLVVFSDELKPRPVKEINEAGNGGRDEDFVIYEDYSPFMMISQASLDELNTKLPRRLTMRSFRPNFTANNAERPFAEIKFTIPRFKDDWNQFNIGESSFKTIKHCTRCLLTTVDPDLGEKSADQEPLNTLRGFRLNKEKYQNSPMFGINFACESGFGNTIRVGDKILLQ